MAGGVKMGGGGGGRRRRGRGRASLMTEINVTPFIDVMLVLLIIFMVTAPLLTTVLPVDLPAAKGASIDLPPKTPLILTVTKEGGVYVGRDATTPTPKDQVVAVLKSAQQNRGADDVVFVNGDKGTTYDNVALVVAMLRQAGFKKLSLVTRD